MPTLEKVLKTLNVVCSSSRELCIVYRLLVELGARLSEMIKMLKEFNPQAQETQWILHQHSGHYHESKRAYYVFTVTKLAKPMISRNW